LLFHRTEQFFFGWVGVLVTALLSLFGIDIVLNLYGQIMVQLMNSLTNTEQSFWGCAGVMFILGSTVAILPSAFSRIGGGVSVALNHASHFLSGRIAAETAGAALVAGAGVGAVAAGASAGTTMAITRLTNSIGSSLSRGL
jgi:hypothetical protein